MFNQKPFIVTYVLNTDAANSMSITNSMIFMAQHKDDIAELVKSRVQVTNTLKIINIQSLEDMCEAVSEDLVILDLKYTAESISDCLGESYTRILDSHIDGIAQPQDFDISDGWCATVMDELLAQGIEQKLGQRVWQNAVDKELTSLLSDSPIRTYL